MTIITAHETVLKAVQNDGSHTMFNNDDPEDFGGQAVHVLLPNALVADMGTPDTVTITVVPGDTLND